MSTEESLLEDKSGGDLATRPEKRSDRQWDIIAGLLPVLACFPLLLFSFAGLWSREHMQFFPCVLLAILAFGLAMDGSSQPTETRLRRLVAVGVLVLAAVLLALSVWWFLPNLGVLSACTVLFAWSLGHMGQVNWGKAGSLACLAGTIILWPANWDYGFIHWLENLAAWGTSLSLDALAIPCILNSGRIEIEGMTLMANEICGGRASVYAFFSFSIAISMLTKRSFLASLASFVTVPVFVLICFYLRLLSILLAYEFWDRDISNGWDFRILEASSIILVAVLIWLASVFFKNLFEPIPVADAEFGPVFSGVNKLFCWPQNDPFEEMEPEDEYERKQFLKLKQREAEAKAQIPKFEWTQDRRVLWVVRVTSILMLVIGLFPFAKLFSQGLEFGIPTVSQQQAKALIEQDSLPKELDNGTWTLTNIDAVTRNPRSALGRYSLNWNYARGQKQFNASVDFPFLGWHDAAAARALQGWDVETHTVTASESWPYGYAELENELGGKAYLFYCLLNRRAEPYVNVPRYLSNDLQQESKAQSANQATSQIQVFIESGEQLTRKERAEIESRFLEIRALIGEEMQDF